ncbi:MAG: 2-oxoacid:acceptor oxidoreductase subunit alpha, partial [Verrucomicrobiota bacterium]|nr:2-oxoacid:acceptor oxidoreductase subunit alpha [Verrucomicrobiota bacterium]
LYDSYHVEPDTDDKRVTYVGIPMTSTTVEAIGGSARDRGKNIFVLGLLTNLFGLNREKLVTIIEAQFKRKHESVLRNAMLAFDSGFAYELGQIHDHNYSFEPGSAEEENRITTDGNSALTYGLLAAGVRYGAGYPITPWSSIMETLRSELPKYGGIFIQSEDELAAIASTIGFAYAGHVAVTGSSGPGLSLKMEALGYASMAELPLVVINVQRGGPSTGLPTSVEQSDLMQAIYGSHGDTPRVVIAPKDVEDCYYTAIEACRIAQEFSTPVIILTDQSLSTRIEAFPEPDLSGIRDPDLDLEPRGEEFLPYPLESETKHAPPGTKMLNGKYPVVTGLEHDEWGHPSSNPELHQKMTNRRRNKLKRLASTLPAPEIYGPEEGDVLLIGWGSTWGPIREAVDIASKNEQQLSAIHLRHIHPMPEGIDNIIEKFNKSIVIEMNDEGLYGYGQLATLLRARYANPNIHSITKTDGLGFKIREIIAGIENITGQ